VSARDYLPLLLDSPAIVRTLRQKYGTPDPALKLPYRPGEAARAAAGVHPDRIEVRVVRTRAETADTRTLVLSPVSGALPPWLPGQYVNVFVEAEGVLTSRPMSIASAPGLNELALTVKRMPGLFVSRHLVDVVQIGDTLSISGPAGDFHHAPVRDGDDLVFIAGGSGITPFIGMIEHLLATRPAARILLLYGSRAPGQIIFERRLRELATQHARFDVIFAVDAATPDWEGEAGPIDAGTLRRQLGEDAASKAFFVCGPPAMQRAMRRHLEALGIPARRIRVEAAGPTDDPTRLPGWPEALDPDHRFELRIAGTSELIEARAGETLLNALERAGHSVPSLCRSGHCGSCRTRLVSGEVATPAAPGIRASDRAAGFIHACVGHPTSDLIVRVSSARARLAASTEPRPAAATTPAPAALPVVVPALPVVETAPQHESGPPWLKILLAAGGLAFFIYLVATSGITVQMLTDVGWGGFGLLLAVSFAVIVLDTGAWWFSLRHVARPGLLKLIGLRLAGDSLTNGLPGGIVLGEPFKAVMARRWFEVSLADNAASLMIVKFGLAISQSIFVLVGLLLIYPLLRERSAEIFGFEGAQYISLALMAGFQLLLLFLLAAVFRGRTFGAAARGLGRLPIPPLRRWLATNTEWITAIDASCSSVFRNNRRYLPATFALLLGSWLVSSLESYVLLGALTGEAPGLTTALAVESVGSMFRLLFFLVPSGIGGQDASFLALFRLFDLPRAAGGAFVLVKRAKELIWIGLGFMLVVLLRRGAPEQEPVAAVSTGDVEQPPAVPELLR